MGHVHDGADAGRGDASISGVSGRAWLAGLLRRASAAGGQALLFTFGLPTPSEPLPALAGVGIIAVPLLWRKQLVTILRRSGAAGSSPHRRSRPHAADGAAIGALGAVLIATLLTHPTSMTPLTPAVGQLPAPPRPDRGRRSTISHSRRARLACDPRTATPNRMISWRAVAVGAGLALSSRLRPALVGLVGSHRGTQRGWRERPMKRISPWGLLASTSPCS